MYRCRLWPPYDVECDRLMGIAAKALHLQIPVACIEGVTECGGRLCRALKGKHTCVPSLTRQTVCILSRIPRALREDANGSPK